MPTLNRDAFFNLLLSRANTSSQDFKKLQRAYWLSKEVHRTQERETGERYFEHPRRVAIILIKRGVTDIDVIAAALLHDAVEDTFTPMEIYYDLFGKSVWDMIFTLSKKIPAFHPITGEVIGWAKKETRGYYGKIALEPQPFFRMIKCADRIDNLRTCANWDQDRKDRYIAETKEFLLPLAEALDDKWFAEELKRLVVTEEKKEEV